MWRVCFFVFLAVAVPSEALAQIPGEAFRDVFEIDSRKVGKEFNAYVTVVDGRVGLMPRSTTASTGIVEWIAQPVDREPHELHKIWIGLDDTKKEVLKKIDPEAMAYDLTGKDLGVYYRTPDERWGGMWKRERHDHTTVEGPDHFFLFCQATEGTLKGYYLDFEEKPIRVPGRFDWKTDFHPARLSKLPTPWGRIIFSGGHHSGVSR